MRLDIVQKCGVTALTLGLLFTSASKAQVRLLAVGELDGSRAGVYADLSGLTYNLENGAPANLLGGLGSGLAYASGNTFLALPDRGPNAISYNSNLDDTVSYVNRFHTLTMLLVPNNSGSGLPFTLTPTLKSTTLLYSPSPLAYGSGVGLGVGSGAPVINTPSQNFFSGRSDNFDGSQNSGYSKDARFDTESIRVSNDGKSVYISDEYGPYVYEFNRTGQRIRSFNLPDSFFVSNLSPVGASEISGNISGRTANKGMEGLAITPDGRTLVGIVQAPLIQDASSGGGNLLRIATIDVETGKTTHQYGYVLTDGSGVSEITALNDHEFVVDERDGKGRADGSKAKYKELFIIDLNGATDISDMNGAEATAHAVPKRLFIDLVSLLKSYYDTSNIPAKIEGVSFGPDVKSDGKTIHTLWVANDNDFLSSVADPNGVMIPNPNQFFVIGFTDADLGGSVFVPQQFK